MAQWPAGYDRLILDQTDSTNEEARRRAPAPAPLWIAARKQTAGRGRLGRADLFTHFAPSAEIATKWPNDALVNGKKAAGILLENFGPAPDSSGGHKANLAIGIGINLTHHPDLAASRWPPTSLAAETGRAPGIEEALLVLADRLDHWLGISYFAIIRAEWLARATHLGQRIEARLPDRTLTGIFEDVDAEGALVLRTPAGPQRITAADIHFAE
jgi:BirA family biotin operon repressor/biotin-[acetyl-CoA-carboxylase] ligase